MHWAFLRVTNAFQDKSWDLSNFICYEGSCISLKYISNKHGKKVNVWAGISKGGKISIQSFTENLTQELYVSIIKKDLKEMETIAGKTLSWYEIMALNI